MNINNINRRNTREWTRVNEDSRSQAHRDAFVSEHGGEFVYHGKRTGWVWEEKVKGPVTPKLKWVFVHPDGKEEIVGDDEAAKFFARERRKGFEIPVV